MASSDVAVVGAGIAGLTAAHRLAGAGADVTVVEGHDEVGGRVLSRQLGDTVAEFGGEWVGDRHLHVMALIRELGLQVEPARQLAHPVLWRGQDKWRSSPLPPLAPGQAVALLQVLRRGRRLARGLDPVAPWRSPGAVELDARSFAGWLHEQGLRGDGYRFLAAMTTALVSRPIDQMSLLHALWWIRRGGGVAPVLRTTFQYRVRQGAQEVCRRIAGRLGTRVLVGRRVVGVDQTARRVRLYTDSGQTIEAAHAIVTAQPGMLAGIDFEPALPEAQQAIDGLVIEPGMKVAALLPLDRRPRHRAALGGGPLAGAWRAGRRVTGFAAPASAGASDDELLGDLARCFLVERSELLSPTVYRWAERPLVAGCDLAFPPMGLTRLGPALKASHGRVHFAGAERGSWPNNMEGAAESGHQVAAAVAAAH